MSRRGVKTGKLGYAYLTRPKREADVLDELGQHASRLGEQLVFLPERRRGASEKAARPSAFARQAMRTDGRLVPADPNIIADRLAKRLAAAMKAPTPWTLQVLAAGATNPKDPRRLRARELDRALTGPLDQALPPSLANAYVEDAREAEILAQVWLPTEDRALLGATRIRDALSENAFPKPTRFGDREGRRGREAFEWMGTSPGRGETCAVLENRKGGWRAAVAKTGAKLIDAEGPASRFAPTETLDWLVVDLNRRGRELASLLGKWARRAWATQFVAVLDVPQRQRVDFLAEIKKTLEEAGWCEVRMRQLSLNHDDQVTVHAWLDPKLTQRGWQKPFELRSQANKDTKPREKNRPRNRSPRRHRR